MFVLFVCSFAMCCTFYYISFQFLTCKVYIDRFVSYLSEINKYLPFSACSIDQCLTICPYGLGKMPTI